jgi:hypothetical protein
LLTALTSSSSSVSLISRATGFDRRSVSEAVQYRKEASDVLYLRMQKRTMGNAISVATTNKIHKFYLNPQISRPMPSKRDVVRVRVAPKVYEDVSKQVLECSLTEAYNIFKEQNPDIKIGQRSFEKRRPAQVVFANLNQRLVCGCVYHYRMDFLTQAVNATMKNLGHVTKFSSSGDLVEATLCSPGTNCLHKKACIERTCELCGVQKLKDQLNFIHDSSTCDCISDIDGTKACTKIIKWKGYEYVTIDNKKRLSFVDKFGSMKEFVTDLEAKINPFAQHRFMAYWTYSVYRMLLENLPKEHCIFIIDFAENYSCKIFHEIQSLHWVTVQATLLIFVIIRHSRPEEQDDSTLDEQDGLVEDHLIIVSNDTKHDVWSVLHARKLVIDWLEQKLGWRPEKIWSISDGAASQFKCATSLLHISAHREDFSGIDSEHMYWETAHGKGKADGVGGVVKNKASMAVVKKQETIRDAKELFTYCKENLTDVGHSSTYASRENAGKTMNRDFFMFLKKMYSAQNLLTNQQLYVAQD